MHGDGRISEHGFHTRGGHDDLLLTAFHLVSERDDDAELDLVRISGHGQQRPSGQLHLVHLDVGNSRTQRARPVDQAIAAENGAIFVQTDKGFDHRAVELCEGGGGWRRELRLS